MRRIVLLGLLSCAHAPPAAPRGFGTDRARAVEVCLPPGEKAYLGTLECPGGSRPHIVHLGSVGTRTEPLDRNDPRILLQMDPERPLAPGEPDLHIVQAVEARCPSATYTLFFDMYHCPAREQPRIELGK